MLTVEQTAERYGVEPSTIREWARTGKIPAIKRGKLWRFDEEQLKADDACCTSGARPGPGGSGSLSQGGRLGSRVAQIARRMRKNLSAASASNSGGR